MTRLRLLLRDLALFPRQLWRYLLRRPEWYCCGACRHWRPTVHQGLGCCPWNLVTYSQAACDRWARAFLPRASVREARLEGRQWGEVATELQRFLEGRIGPEETEDDHA